MTRVLRKRIGATIAVFFVSAGALLTVSSWGNDVLAGLFEQESHEVDEVMSDQPADAFAFWVQTSDGRSKLVLAASQRAVAERLLTEDGDALAVSCLLAPHRIVPGQDGRWRVAMLPSWLSGIGRSTCEHGGRHAPAPRRFEPENDLEAALSAGVEAEDLQSVLLEADIWLVDASLRQDLGAAKVRLPAIDVDGETYIPVFTSPARVADVPAGRVSKQPFRLLLEIMDPPKAPVILNPGLPESRVLSMDQLVTLRMRL